MEGGAKSYGNSKFNKICGNTIKINSYNYVSGIYISCGSDAIVSNNDINLFSKNFAYGIVAEYSELLGSINNCSNITISANTIDATSSMVYGIELFSIFNVNIASNIITTLSNASYGIVGYGCYNHNVIWNDISINGSDISIITNNFDVIGTGHAGICYIKNSNNLTISNNNILSYYVLGGDYAIRFDDSSLTRIYVTYNNLTSNKFTYIGDNAVNGKVRLVNNKAYVVDNITFNAINYTSVNIYVNLNGSDSNGNGSFKKPFLTINKALMYLKNLKISNKTANIKGIIYIGEGTFDGFKLNLRDFVVDFIGYNTIIDGKSNWFLQTSSKSIINIKNVTFINGVFNQDDAGLFNNKGILNFYDCKFYNSNLFAKSGIIYNNGVMEVNNCIFDKLIISNKSSIICNVGILKLKNNSMSFHGGGYSIYNSGKIDNVVLNIFKDSSIDDDRIIKLNSPYIELVAYLHDDNGNCISGGIVKFFIESKEISLNTTFNHGKASISTFVSSINDFRVSASYLNAYANIVINYGYVVSNLSSNDVKIYVNESALIDGDGSINNPYNSINKPLSLINSSIGHWSIILLDGYYQNSLNSFDAKYGVTFEGIGNVYILNDWVFNTTSNIELNNLIFYKSSIVNFYSNITIKKCLFTNSSKTALYSSQGNVKISDSNFTFNNIHDYHYVFKTGHVVVDKGGAIFNTGGFLMIFDSMFMGNEACHGGAIFNTHADLHISSCKFIDNLAFGGFNDDRLSYSVGGAICQLLGNEIIVSDTIFFNNTANGQGGAFYYAGSNLQYIWGVFSNTGLAGGGVLNENPQDLYFINCNFTNNLAPLSGGAVYIFYNSLTNYINCIFSQNLVYTYDIIQLLAQGSMGRNWFYPNEVSSLSSISLLPINNGGAIYDGNVIIIGSTFEGNTAESGGLLVVPSLLSSAKELKLLNKHYVGITFLTYHNNNERIYVEDSSLLTSRDSKFIGIGKWVGKYDGPSISKYIKEYYDAQGSYPSSTHGNGNGGFGTGGSSGYANGSKPGTGSGGQSNLNIFGSLTWGQILNYLNSQGSNIAINNGNHITIEDIISKLNQNSNNQNNNSQSSDSSDSHDTIKINGTTNKDSDNSGGHIVNDGVAVSVGVSSNSLNGVVNDGDEFSSKDSSRDKSYSSSSDSSSGSPYNSYEILKDVNKEVIHQNNEYFILILIILFILLIIGFYKNNKR